MSTPSVCGVDDGFYRVKRANLDPERRWVFRYALKESDDGQCDRGGQAEIGGNDLVVLNTDARRLDDAGREIWPGGETFMHELGHNLGLFRNDFAGIDNQDTRYPWKEDFWLYGPYHSCMNYRYTWHYVNYSHGTQGEYDFDDWGNIDLKHFLD